MKKFVYGVIAVTLAASLCGCGNVKDAEEVKPNENIVTRKEQFLKIGCLTENAVSEEEYSVIINEAKDASFKLTEMAINGELQSGDDRPSGDFMPSGEKMPSGEMMQISGGMPEKIEPHIPEKTDDIEKSNHEERIDVKMSYYDNLNAALLALDKGDVEVLSLYDSVCKYIVNQNPEKYKSDALMTRGSFAMATLDTNKELVDKINDAIDALRKDGTITKLEEKYIANNEAGAVELPKIEGAATYRVVVTGDLPPMDYVTADGKAEGFNMALLAEISKKAGINFEIVSADAGSRAIMITSGKADLMFWTKGLMKAMGGEYSYEADLPEGLIATQVYHEENLSLLMLTK